MKLLIVTGLAGVVMDGRGIGGLCLAQSLNRESYGWGAI